MVTSTAIGYLCGYGVFDSLSHGRARTRLFESDSSPHQLPNRRFDSRVVGDRGLLERGAERNRYVESRYALNRSVEKVEALVRDYSRDIGCGAAAQMSLIDDHDAIGFFD